jgi:hypothetical protein
VRTPLKKLIRGCPGQVAGGAILFVALLAVAPPSAEAGPGDVVMMGDRDALRAVPLVVWGNTKHPIGSPFTLDYGDSSPDEVGVVTDQTYIAFQHTYAAAGVYTATLTVLGDTSTAVIEVFDPAALTPASLRSLRINMAIEDGLRYLYIAQDNRQLTYNTNKTSWQMTGTFGADVAYWLSYTSLTVLAFENHGHTVLDDPAEDIYQPVVQRGLNMIFDRLSTVPLTVEPAGNPCVGVPADANQCVGLGIDQFNGHSMYASAVVVLAVAGSGAPARTVDAGIGVTNGFFVAGRTYAEILQRQSNTIVWGMNDGPGTQQGGFDYVLDRNVFGDGSTAGWGVLALLDAEAAGATLPAFVRPEVDNYAADGLNADGSLKYQVFYGPISNFPKTGIALEVMFFINRPLSDGQVQGAINLLDTFWATGYSTDTFVGANKGHSYGMFNAFKGLKLYGVNNLPTVGDWHADYQDYLVADQLAPNTVAGGNWHHQWSHCGFCDLGGGEVGGTAIAELILSPVALVLPANLTLAPASDTNEVGEPHTVTATATSSSGSGVAGATVTFTVTAGPNMGVMGTGVTNASGEATFTYTSAASGTDTIQASIGELDSNTVQKTWFSDVDDDTIVDEDDNCPTTPNPDQLDTDKDGVGDACDNCPFVFNPGQEDNNGIMDGDGIGDACENAAPVCEAAAPTIDEIWPPNHRMVGLGVTGVTDPDGDPVTINITGIRQDEPTNTVGDGNTACDAQGVGGPMARVRAERSGSPRVPGDGRFYHLFFTASDPGGAICQGSVKVVVPHDRSHAPVDQGPLYASCTP